MLLTFFLKMVKFKQKYANICHKFVTINGGHKMQNNIRKRGNIYHYDILIDGLRYRGSCQTADKNLARKVADTIKADIIRQKHSMPSMVNYNFIDLWKIYMSSQLTVKATKAVKECAAKHFLPIFQDKPIQSINRDQIENYQFKRRLEVLNMPKNIGKREHEISFRFINIEIATLSNFFNFCITKGYIDKNPANKMKRLNELSRLKTLSDEDIKNLINKAPLKHTRDLITFLIFTGCRKGEALNLKWNDVDLKNNVIAIKATKTKHDRYIPIHSKLKTLLKNIEKKENCEYVFNFKGRKITTFVDSFHTACRNAGLKDLRIHDLRHVFASALTMADVSLYKTGILLGHRTPNMTQRYAHLKPSELKKEIEKAFGKEDHKDLKREEYEWALKIIREYENEKNGGK